MTPSPSIPICPKCGRQADAADRFCLECGTLLPHATIAPQPPLPDVDVAAPKRWGKALWVILAMLLLLVGGIGWYLFGQRTSHQPPASTDPGVTTRMAGTLTEFPGDFTPPQAPPLSSTTSGSTPTQPPAVPAPVSTTPPPVPIATFPATANDPPEFGTAHALFVANRYAEALPHYNAALQKLPGHRQAASERAVVRLWLNDVNGALSDWTALATKDPNDLDSRRHRAGLELIVGDRRVGLAESEALLKLSPNNAWLFVLHGQASVWNNNNEAAKGSFTRAVQLDPNIPANLYNQGGQFLAAGVPSVALLQYTAVLWIDPNLAGAYYGLGFAYSGLGQTERAIDSLERYLRLDQTSAFAQQANQQLQRLKRQ